MRNGVVCAVALSFGLLTTTPIVAHADETDACLSAHVEAQRQRLAGKLRDARERLVACSQAACPSLLRAECSQWMGEVDRSLPTIVLAARGADGQETTAVRVQIDGDPPQDRLPANAVALDPGEHVVRFTDARGTVVTERVILREGEKNKMVWVAFPPIRDAGRRPSAPPSRDLPPAFFVIGAIGVLGVGAFATLGILGKNEESRLDDCKGHCTRDEVAPMYRFYAAADISLAVGAVALGVATYLGIRHMATNGPPSARAASPWVAALE